MPRFTPKVDYILREVQVAKERASKGPRGKVKYFDKIEPNTALYFYLLPPWSEEGRIFRMVYKHFNIPTDGGKKSAVYTCWRTFDDVHPGLGEKCPVCEALRGVQAAAAGSEAYKKLWSSAKAYVNAKILGTRPLNEVGAPVSAPLTPPKGGDGTYALQLSYGAFHDLLAQISDPKVGWISDPDAAVAVTISRKDGAKTVYALALDGATSVTSGFIPTRTKMFENKEEEDRYLNNLADLVAMFPEPDEEDKVNGHKHANAIRLAFGVAGGLAGTPSFPSPEAKPWDSVPNAPTMPSTPFSSPASTPVASAAPVVNPGPSVPVEKLFTEPYGPTPPPGVDGTNKPLCFGNTFKILASPNAVWCSLCNVKTPCQIVSRK
jgi:hypothetical protein